MANPYPLSYPPSFDLATLNTQCLYKEGQLGPLINIGNDGTSTVLTWDTDGDAPDKHAVIYKNGTQPTTGVTTVASGKIFLSDSLTDCTAVRPS